MNTIRNIVAAAAITAGMAVGTAARIKTQRLAQLPWTETLSVDIVTTPTIRTTPQQVTIA